MHTKFKYVKLIILSISFFNLFDSSTTEARTFKNAYISFEIDDSWKCQLEQTEWICRSENPQEAKEAIIILTAKEKGPSDNFTIYTEHLSKPITLTMRNGQTMQSSVTMPPVEQTIGEQLWLDGLHVNSEVKNYYTRYLATIKDQIAILVTFSVHNKFYTKYTNQFMNTVKSLRVIATKDLLQRPDLGPIRGSGEVLGAGVGQAMPSDLLTGEDELLESQEQSVFQNDYVKIGLLLILLIAAYIGLKIYQKNKQ